jgi:DNA-binding transcriptional ArsR family regulator
VLELLVKSKVRRRLLYLLWGEGKEGSASELAAMAGVGFANVYRELKAMKRLDLVITRREGGVERYRANENHPVASALRTLATERTRRFPSPEGPDRELRLKLKALGAPLNMDGAAERPDDPEETLVAAVRLSHRDPAVARSLPVCLWNVRETLDKDRLVGAAREKGEKPALGFFLDLTTKLSGDARFSAWARALRDHRVRAIHEFFDTAPSRDQETAEAGAALAAKWGFRMNLDQASFEKLFREFANG